MLVIISSDPICNWYRRPSCGVEDPFAFAGSTGAVHERVTVLLLDIESSSEYGGLGGLFGFSIPSRLS